MYVFVTVSDRKAYYDGLTPTRQKVRIEQASGERCLIVPHEEFDLRAVNDLRPRAILMSGFGRHFQARRIEQFYGMDEVLHRADIPILAICGSHQLLAFSFTRDFRKTKRLRDQPMRKLRPSEEFPHVPCADPKYDLSPYYVAQGFFPIRRVKADEIFAGLPRTMMMKCSHYCEVKKLPPGFELLATGGHCRIEMMRHPTRPLYGAQFHPEAYEPPFLHGRKLLENFAKVADDFWDARGRATVAARSSAQDRTGGRERRATLDARRLLAHPWRGMREVVHSDPRPLWHANHGI